MATVPSRAEVQEAAGRLIEELDGKNLPRPDYHFADMKRDIRTVCEAALRRTPPARSLFVPLYTGEEEGEVSEIAFPSLAPDERVVVLASAKALVVPWDGTEENAEQLRDHYQVRPSAAYGSGCDEFPL